MSTVLHSGGLDVDKRVVEVVPFVAEVVVVATTVVVVRLVMMTEIVVFV